MGRQAEESSGGWLPAKPAGGDADARNASRFLLQTLPSGPSRCVCPCNLEVFKEAAMLSAPLIYPFCPPALLEVARALPTLVGGPM